MHAKWLKLIHQIDYIIIVTYIVVKKKLLKINAIEYYTFTIII